MSQSGKMSGKKHAFSLVFLIILIVGTFAFLLKDIGIKGVIHAVRQANAGYMLIAFMMLLLYLVCEGEAIRAVTKSLGYPVRLRRGFVYACTDFYFSAITPSATGGQPVCLYYMSKDQIPVSVSGLAMLLQTVVYKLILLVLGIWALFAKWSFFAEGNWTVKLLFVVGFLINVIVIIICLLAMFSQRVIKRIGEVVIRIGAKLHLIKKPEETLQRLMKSLQEYTKGAQYIRTHLLLSIRVLIVTFVQRIAMFSIAYWIYCAMGGNEYNLYDMMALQTLIAMAIDSLPLPGGVGATEGIFTMLYRVIYGAKLIPGLILTRGINYYCGLIVSSIAVIVNQSRIVREEKMKEEK